MKPRKLTDEEVDQRIDEALAVLEEDGPEAALELAASLPEDEPYRFVIEAAALQDLLELDAAREAFDRAVELGADPEDPDVLWTEGQLLLREWKNEQAEKRFTRLLRQEKSAAVLERLALCAELRGDGARAGQLLKDAARFDPDAFAPVPRLTQDAFGRVVEQAIADLPETFRAALDQTRIVIEPVPSRELAFEGDPDEIEPETLGLFTGRSLLDAQHDDAPGPPPTIHLFQRNLERAASDEEELRAEIRVTLYHELGHYLGFDEEGVDRMGLG